MKHLADKVKCVRYVYIIGVDNRGRKSAYYGYRNIFYTGQTINLARRFKQHLNKIDSNFLSKYFPNARKKLVFVKQLYGDEYDAMALEWKVKRLSRSKKVELINSGENDLISYVPLKYIILKKFNKKDEEFLIKL